ncbi:MAG: ABC transporter substrate-binding protein [Anaerolineaceae bacterium]|nr:ABC transporter substrate-binding protein [Anaerolineaceae bacterium]
MRSKILVFVSLIIISGMLLGACQPAAPQTIVETVIVEGEPVEIIVTTTPVPEEKTEESDVEELPNVSPDFNSPDTMTVITGAGEQETMDPAWMYDTASSTLSLNLYEGLTFFNREKTDEFIPALATDWSVNEDQDQWVFNIREGVQFHEGGTLEPHDVAYTVHRAMLQGRIDGYSWITYEAFFGPELAMGSIKDFAAAYTEKETFEELSDDELVAVCEAIQESVVADDEAGTVTYNLAAPVPWIFSLTSQQFLGGILDKEWMVDLGDWDGDCANWVPFADPAAEDSLLFGIANGTGPYMLDHWTPGEETVLVANENYWRTEPMWDGGPSGIASIARVVIKNITEWGTRLAMFEAGDADYIYAPPQYRPQLEPFLSEKCNIDESSCEAMNPNGYIKGFRELPQPAITPAQFNWQINVEGGNPYVGSGELDGNGIPSYFFTDIHIRKAFNYCFDYGAMVKDALANEGVQAQGPIPMGMMGYIDGEEPLYTYDLAKCEEEFKLADLDLDGIPAGEDDDDVWSRGFYMQMAYNNGNDTRQLASEILKAGLEAVNPSINVGVVAMPWPVLLNSRRAGKLPMYVGGWVEDYHDPHNWAHPFLHSQGAYGRIVNMPDDVAAEYDALIVQGATEGDVAARTQIYQDMQKRAQEEAINIWMYQVLDGIHYQNWIDGFYYNPAYGNPEYGWIYGLSKVAP